MALAIQFIQARIEVDRCMSFELLRGALDRFAHGGRLACAKGIDRAQPLFFSGERAVGREDGRPLGPGINHDVVIACLAAARFGPVMIQAFARHMVRQFGLSQLRHMEARRHIGVFSAVSCRDEHGHRGSIRGSEVCVLLLQFGSDFTPNDDTAGALMVARLDVGGDVAPSVGEGLSRLEHGVVAFVQVRQVTAFYMPTVDGPHEQVSGQRRLLRSQPRHGLCQILAAFQFQPALHHDALFESEHGLSVQGKRHFGRRSWCAQWQVGQLAAGRRRARTSRCATITLTVTSGLRGKCISR